MKAEIKRITPEMAREMLEHNGQNRRINSNTVMRYAHLMKTNQWHSNGESISIDENGNLVNGQHRLLACIEANVPFCCVVVYGVKKQDSFVFDSGQNRTRKGTIEIAQKAGEMEDLPLLRNNDMISAATFLLGIKLTRERTGDAKSVNPDSFSKWISAEECAAFILGHRDAFEHCYYWIAKVKGSRIRRAPIIAAIVQAYESGYPMQKLERFAEVMNSGVPADEKERPIIKLRDWTMTTKGGTQTVRRSAYLRTQYMLKAFEKGNAKAVCREATTEYYIGAY